MKSFNLWQIFRFNSKKELDATPRGVVQATISNYLAGLEPDKIDPIRLTEDVCIQLNIFLKTNNCFIIQESAYEFFSEIPIR